MAQLKDLVVLGKSRFIGDLYANKIVGTIEGKISDADRATSDALDQNIASTYIKNITADGKTITFTKGDGTFASFDTQDTTYAQATADTLGLVKVVGSTGTSTTDVMSQKAVTDALSNIQPEVSNAFVDAALAKDNTGVRRLNFTRGNGSTVEYDLSFAQATDSVLGLVKVTGSTGTSTTDVMSQKAVTDALSNIHVDNALTEVALTKDATGTRVLTFTKGDGSTADYDLSFAQATDSVLGLVKVTGSTGTSTTDVMSQKAVTDELGTKVESISMTKQDNTRKLIFTKGNGTTSEYDLSYNQATDSVLGLVKVTGSTGTSTTDVMSQKAVSDELSAVDTALDNTLQSVELTKDNTGVRKLTFTKGDGSTAEYDMSFAQATNNVLGLVKVQGSTGTSTTDVMTQKATSDAVNDKLESVSLSKDNTGSRVLTFTKGDGSTADYDLSFAQATDSVLGLVKVNGSTGTSTTDVMTQKAVTDELSSLDTRLTPIENISSNFTIENGKLCYIASDGTNSGDNSNGTAEPLTLDETLQDIADTLGDISQNISNVSAATAAQTTTNWLNEHVDPSRDVVIDDSLTISGAAADAKVTGDNVRELKSALTYSNKGLIDNAFIDNGIINSEGVISSYNGYSVTSYRDIFGYAKVRIVSSVQTDRCRFYDSTKTPIGDSNFTVKIGTNIVTVPSGAYYLAVSLPTADRDGLYIYTLIGGLTYEMSNGLMEEINLTLDPISFVAGYFNGATGASSTSSGWSRGVTNFLEGIPSDVVSVRAKITTAKAFILVFSAKPNYANGADNSSVFVNGYFSQNVGDEIEVPIDPSYYYVLQSNVSTSDISNMTVNLKVNKGSDHYGFAKNKTKFNKTFSVMGDSISTYTGISPSGTGYASLYPTADVTNVSGMWWYKLAEMTGMRINRINANSGSTVCADANPGRVECSSDERCSDLGTNPDYIICYCGINDFYLNVDMGTYDGTRSLASATRTTFKEAYASMLYKMHTNYPHAKIYCGLIQQNIHSGYDTLSDNLQTVVNGYGRRLVDFNNTIKELAEMFGCRIINIDKCGFNLDNLEDYTIDSSPNCFHPNDSGHTLMALQAFKDMGLIE